MGDFHFHRPQKPWRKRPTHPTVLFDPNISTPARAAVAQLFLDRAGGGAITLLPLTERGRETERERE
jgi:hypothetical protein